MRLKLSGFFGTGVLVSIAFVVIGFAQTGSEGKRTNLGSCNRVCLDGYVDKYLNALTAHDPGRAPTSMIAKFTENTVRLKLGEGVWRTATEVGDYRIRLADPKSGQAVFFGILKEGPQADLFTLRIRVEDQQISEVETILVRPQPGSPVADISSYKLKTARPAFSEALKPSERVPREKMIAATNAYYEGIERGTGQIVPFAEDCHRIENGQATVNNPDRHSNYVSMTGRTLPNFTAMGCREQFDTGIWASDNITDRRFPVVDEERGVVAAFTIYNSHGTSKCVNTPMYGSVCPGPGFMPHSLDLLEMMKIRNGEIHEQESIFQTMSPGIKSGW